MADDMEKKGQQSGQTGQGQHGTQTGQGGQPDQQDQPKKGGQFDNEQDDQNRDRQRRAS